jgi:hypothetical protein
MMGSVVSNIFFNQEFVKMKVKLNPMFEQVSGQLGEMVFRELRGETVVSRKPIVTAEPSADQLAHRELFKQAAAYGKSVMADANTRALYEEAAKIKNIPVFALTIADFFNAPVIDSLDLSEYNGQAGSLIRISARDDFGVASVYVSILNGQNNPVESGNAVETAAGSGQWVYTATGAVSQGTTVTVNAVATDRPGGSVVSSGNKSF